MTAEGHVVGVDAGGTSTRALVADAAGTVLGTGRGAGANPHSHPPEEAAARIAEAISAALTGLDHTRTLACVVGMAGVSKLSDPAVAAVFERAWHKVGLGDVVRVVSDAEAAFASATAHPDGTVLIAGTGSIAGRIRDRRLVSTAGGYGWLLGDEGSAFWLGKQAVRSTLAALASGERLGGLHADVLAEALGLSEMDDPPAADRLALSRRLITLVNGEAPIRLARFAPLVSAASDPAARVIVTAAAEFLISTAMSAREPGEDTPIVLVGSVLGDGSPVGEVVRSSLSGLPGLSGLEVLSSSDGVLGAAWLAAVDAFGERTARPGKV